MDKLPSKLCSAWYLPSSSRSPRPSSCGKASANAAGSINNSRHPTGRSCETCAENGFLLALLLPILVLLGFFLLGTIGFTERAQARAALQARLDVCAVKLAAARERFYFRLAKANEGVEATKVAIYAARAAMLIPGAGEAAAAGQQELLALNATLAAAEDGLWMEAATAELSRLRCAPSGYSRESAACLVSPLLSGALQRQKTLFPDVRGTLVHLAPGNSLARVHCTGLAHAVATGLEVRGDPALRQLQGYTDAYTP